MQWSGRLIQLMVPLLKESIWTDTGMQGKHQVNRKTEMGMWGRCQRTPKLVNKQKLEERQGTDVSLPAFRRNQHFHHLNHGLLTSRLWNNMFMLFKLFSLYIVPPTPANEQVCFPLQIRNFSFVSHWSLYKSFL